MKVTAIYIPKAGSLTIKIEGGDSFRLFSILAEELGQRACDPIAVTEEDSATIEFISEVSLAITKELEYQKAKPS